MKTTAVSPSSCLASIRSRLVALKRPRVMLAACLAGAFGLADGGLSTCAAAQNLIVNGGFESGNFSGWTLIPAPLGTDFGVGNLTSIYQVANGGTLNGIPQPFAPYAGNWAAYFGAVSKESDTIEQTIRRPLFHGEYQVSFFLGVGPTTNLASVGRFQALWNGQVVYSTVNTPQGAYQHIVTDQQSTRQSASLAFQAYEVGPFYLLDDVSVKLVGLSPWAGLTPNESSVVGALNSGITDPRLGSTIRFLEGQSSHDLPVALDRLAPAELTSIFTIGTALATEQSLNIQRRTDDIRSGSSGFSAAGLAINGGGPSYSGGFGITSGVAGPSGDDGKETKEMKTVAPADNRWGAFLSGTGEWVNVSGTDNARGYELANGGFTLGVDYKVCPNFAIGLMAGYTGSTADLTDHGRVWVNGGNLGVYATTFVGGWYADVAATGGYSSYDTRRGALDGTARGDTDGGNINALFGTGYDFKAGGLTFGPTASFNYTYTGTDGFTETGSLAPLNIHGGQGESLRSAFGVKASYDCKVGSVLIKPEVRAAWQHEYGDTVYSLDSDFANGAGGNFTVGGPKLGRDSALIGAGFAIQCSERCSTYLYYDGELGRTNYLSNSVTGGVRVAF